MLEKSESMFTPRELVSELDRYIVGQAKAKRAVAVALRTRWRRQLCPEDVRDEISPKNIILMGPTGVGKTEIARRLAKLVRAPFIKVEATKFTEVGYVGRDVDSMIRDLTDLAVNMVKAEAQEAVMAQGAKAAEERILDILLPPPPARARPGFEERDATPDSSSAGSSRDKMRHRLRAGELNDRTVEIELAERGSAPMLEVFSSGPIESMDSNIRDMLGNIFPKKSKKRSISVKDALVALTEEEAQKLVDMDTVVKAAIMRTEQAGIVFIDEIDKIAVRSSSHGPDVSRQGVQRDILPIVEGSTVNTKHGLVRTDHILFIAAGAFHIAKPSDLMPELQGRFPIRVELESLSKDDFVRILTEPENSLTRQYQALLATEGVVVDFSADAIVTIAEIATEANQRMENIGARRLHTILELLLDDLSFDAPEKRGTTVKIDAAYVTERLAGVLADEDLSKYIL